MERLIEEIKNELRSDLTAKRMTGDDYSESLRNSIAQLLVIAEKYEKIEEIAKETQEGCITKYRRIEEVLGIRRWED